MKLDGIEKGAKMEIILIFVTLPLGKRRCQSKSLEICVCSQFFFGILQ